MERDPTGNVEGFDIEGSVSEADVVLDFHVKVPEGRTPIGLTMVDDGMLTTREGLEAYLGVIRQGEIE